MKHYVDLMVIVIGLFFITCVCSRFLRDAKEIHFNYSLDTYGWFTAFLMFILLLATTLVQLAVSICLIFHFAGDLTKP